MEDERKEKMSEDEEIVEEIVEPKIVPKTRIHVQIHKKGYYHNTFESKCQLNLRHLSK